MIKSRKMRWEDNVACMLEIRSAYEVSGRKPEGGNHL
jgi:hypothetical protein